MIDVALDSGFDEEGLSTLEKIYLYARSDSTVHRTFIAHALPSYLEQVTPQEAVEYVLPLIHNLAVDEGGQRFRSSLPPRAKRLTGGF
jgi:serine/threonine-protein phosphatase 4 regulatory subunit 1